MTTQPNWDELRDAALADNTAQGILKYLRELKSNRTAMRTRWIWELFQNARDASIDADTPLIVSVEYERGDIIFRHNGRGFAASEITHLIHHGSTKVETDEAIGKFGSGFLTTHLLSSEINVSGQLDTGRSFEFRLKREDSSVAELRDSMDESWNDFKHSLSSLCTQSLPSNFTTQFQYPILDGVSDVVNEGLTMLKRCAPFVIVFNKEFSYIDVKTPDGIGIFKVAKRTQLSHVGWEIRVSENKNGNWKDKVYLLAEGKKTSVAIPLEDDGQACLLVNSIPRLFLGFPLVGTEEFSFPAIINSFKFSPTENRDGVYLGEDDDANSKNEAIIEEACELLVSLLHVAASAGWRNIYALADIPQVNEQNQKKKQWIQKCLNKQLIEKIRQTSAVLNEDGEKINPDELKLPFAETTTGTETLWDLLDGCQDCREILPRQSEAIGWWNAVKSWVDICGSDRTSFDEVIDGGKLALLIQSKANSVESLQGFLRDGICAIEWLDRFYTFLQSDRQYEVVRTYSIIPNQSGELDKLSNLYRDQDIDEELKDIAELLGGNIRRELRDKRLYSLVNEVGAGDRTREDVVQKLITQLREHVEKAAEKDLDDNFKKASARLFAWLVNQEDWNRLQGFSVFAIDGNSVLDLPTAHGGEPPLAPICVWPEGLKQFADLFPPDRILADDFKVCAPEAWEQLDKQGLIRNSMVITYNEKNLKALSPDLNQEAEDVNQGESTHEAVHCITATDVVERDAIMDRVRNRPKRAFLFWRFLTEWLIKEYGQGMEIQEALCTCKETHEYYPAAWLIPVRNKSWIRLEGSNTRVRADAQRLANLLRNNEWAPGSLSKNPAAIKLLKAIGVERFDLMRQLAAEDDDARVAMDSAFIDMLSTVEGEVNYLKRAREYIEDLKNDENLPDVLEKRRKQRKRVAENQYLGKRIEQLVKESLEEIGFDVNRKPIGSDFEIEHDLVENDEEIGIELVQGRQSWLIEVKATRGKEVRMTFTQAKTAVEQKDNFLLCVVPLDLEDIEGELDTVRTKMRFVTDIGSQIDQLCKNLDAFEQLRDDITAGNDSGVRLEVILGTAGIRVAHTLWEDEGLPLETLGDYLK